MGQRLRERRVKCQTRTERSQSLAGGSGLREAARQLVSGGHGEETKKTLECHMTSGEYVMEAE